MAPRRPKHGQSLFEKHPEIADRWHPTKNDELTPLDVSYGSGVEVWWKCPVAEDHEWKAKVCYLSSRPQYSGCPSCKGLQVSVTNSLLDNFPEIASEWHSEKNGKLNVNEITYGNDKKVWWKCSNINEHEWEASPNSRTNMGTGCPICANQNRGPTGKPKPGESLKDLFPKVAAYWHPTKNGSLSPSEITYGSGRKVWWKCPVAADHEWEASINDRTGSKPTGSGCPFCAGIKVSTSNSFHLLFPQLSSQWHPKKNGKLRPENYTYGSGIKVWWKCPVAADHEWEASINDRTGSNSLCPFCNNLKFAKSNSLQVLYPEVASEWNPKRNGTLKPSEIRAGSNKKVWWKCPEGEDHEWEAIIRSRTYQGSSCPFCSNLKVSVTNSLAKTFPRLAGEWHPTKNGNITPADVIAGSNKKYWWKCSAVADHEWRASLKARSSAKTNCPKCAGRTKSYKTSRKLSSSNSLATLFPLIAAEWHPTKNGNITPADVIAGSNKRYWWKCSVAEDHEWEAQPNNRCFSNQNCPACANQKVSITNSLATLFPSIAAEWHPTKNENITPADVIAGSHKKYWWKCDIFKDHEWEASLGARTGLGSGCPECTLTPRSAQEILIAYELSAVIPFDVNRHKFKFDGKLRDVDIAIENLQLIIEFDGAYWHRNKQLKDLEKTKLMEAHGWEVIRIRELPLKSIHKNDIMVRKGESIKTITNKTLSMINDLTEKPLKLLHEYLLSDDLWREKEALVAIHEYQAENAKKKAARDAKKKQKATNT